MENSISYNYIQVGKEIWYKNRQDSPTDMPYLLSKVKSKNNSMQICILTNGESVQYSNTLPYYNNANINVDDLSGLDEINEMDILNNLLNRFSSKIYFTNIGDILLFLNPYANKEKIYSEEILSLYNKKNLEVKNTLYIESHTYKNMYNIIKKLKHGKANKQTVLIQGENCTGKSEIINQSIRYVLSYFRNKNSPKKKSGDNNDNNGEYIAFENNFNEINENNNVGEDEKINENAYIFNTDNSGTSNEGGFYSIFNYKLNQGVYNNNIPKKIIASIVVLEAFGNAKTINNNNSTRIIKFIKLKINQAFTKLTGAEVFAFLFDKNRVTNIEANKGNNFNIFYYLLNCGNNDFLQKLFLSSDNFANYYYLIRDNNNIDNSLYSKNKFKELKEALITLGFNNGEMFSIFKILSAILLLGNTEIKIDDELKLIINKKENFSNICNLLNIDSNEFISALINQEASLGNNLYYNNDNILYHKSTYNYYNGNDEIQRMKNNFCNELYNQLFLWIVNKINNNINYSSSFDNEGEKSITFFDFCGYENDYSYKYNNIIYLNSLEQIFINYINELMFYFYLKDYYLTNLKFFQKEGVDYIADKVSNEYDNKKDILNSINYLFNEIKNMQNDRDIKTFISNLEKDKYYQGSKKKYKKVKYNRMIKNSSNSNYFLIHHTSEDVFYNMNGFLNKNNNNFIPWSLLDCLLKSKNPIIRNIYKNNRINSISINVNNSDYKSNHNNYYNYNYENIINNGFVTLGDEYKCFIKDIKKEIKQSQRNYIICLKSNQNKKPLIFNPNYIFNQLKYFNLLFSIKQLEQNFYPILYSFIDFYNKFKITQEGNIVNEFEETVRYNADSNSTNLNDLYKKECLNIINDLINYNNKNNKDNTIIVNDDLILFGKNKILMKEKLYNVLDQEKERRIDYKTKATNIIILGINYIKNRRYFIDLKNKIMNDKVEKVQALLKGFIEKNKMEKYNGLMFILQNSLRVLNAKKKFNDLEKNRNIILVNLEIYLDKIIKRNMKNSMPPESPNRKEKILDKVENYACFSNYLENNPDMLKNGVNGDNNNLSDVINLTNNQLENNKIASNSHLEDATKKESENQNDQNENNANDKDNINKDSNKENASKQEEDKKLKTNEDKDKKKSKKEKRLTIINVNKAEEFLKGMNKMNDLNKKINKNNNNNNTNGVHTMKIFTKLNILRRETKHMNIKLNVEQIKNKAGVKVIQENCLLYKIKKKKKGIKAIFNHSYSILVSRYYTTMKKEVRIIQKHIKTYKERQDILNNAIYKKMSNISNSINETDKKINKILFPYRKMIINMNLNKESNNINNNDKIDNSIIKNKNNNSKNKNINEKDNKGLLSTYEKYKNYKKRKQIYKNNSRKSNFSMYSFDQNISNKIGNMKSMSTKINDRKNSNLNQLKEEEKDMNYFSNSEKKDDYNEAPKLLKNIPNLSYNNKYKDILLSSTVNNQTNDYEQKYYDNKLYFLSKIIDIDILNDISYNEEIDETFWVKEYKKIYEYNLNNKTPIQQIYLSDTHTLLINNKGNIFFFGFNDKGQCGQNIENNISTENENKNKNLNFNYFTSDMAINFYKYYSDLYGNVKEAILGDGYTLILNDKDKTYTFGDGFQLNIQNNSNNNVISNSIINNNNNLINIKSINGKGNINIFLTKNNDLYFNLTSNKKFIINTPTNNNTNSTNFYSQNIPIQIFIDKRIKIASISCGYNFYILLSKQGKVYGAGSNDHGELCSKENINPRFTPEEIIEVSKLKEKVIQVSCGFKHVIILTSNNNVYGWGNNSFGQLFSGQVCRKSDIIKLNNDGRRKIIQVCSGFRSSFILNDINEIYYFGVLNRNKKNITGEPEQVFIEEKNDEYGNKNDFIPVKINSRWNKQISLLNVTFADIRNFSFKAEYSKNKIGNEKLKDILTVLSSKWLVNSIKVPYIQEISQYFNKNYMDKPDKTAKVHYY